MRRGIGRRGPGLVGTVARTAVIAGTATVVAGGIQGHQQQKAAAQQQAAAADQAAFQSQQDIAAMQQQMAAMQAQQAQAAIAPAAAPAAAPAGGITDETMAQLQKLGELQAAGILTPEEFAAAKAKLLA